MNNLLFAYIIIGIILGFWIFANVLYKTAETWAKDERFNKTPREFPYLLAGYSGCGIGCLFGIFWPLFLVLDIFNIFFKFILKRLIIIKTANDEEGPTGTE